MCGRHPSAGSAARSPASTAALEASVLTLLYKRVRGRSCQALPHRALGHFLPPAWLSTLVFWQTLPVTLKHEDQPDEFPRPGAAPQAEPPKIPPREVGGRQGPEPTRYGDWEVRGRCIDF
jgi:Protein of unknown function (DUF1674)